MLFKPALYFYVYIIKRFSYNIKIKIDPKFNKRFKIFFFGLIKPLITVDFF